MTSKLNIFNTYISALIKMTSHLATVETKQKQLQKIVSVARSHSLSDLSQYFVEKVQHVMCPCRASNGDLTFTIISFILLSLLMLCSAGFDFHFFFTVIT